MGFFRVAGVVTLLSTAVETTAAARARASVPLQETDGIDGKSIYIYGNGWEFGEETPRGFAEAPALRRKDAEPTDVAVAAAAEAPAAAMAAPAAPASASEADEEASRGPSTGPTSWRSSDARRLRQAVSERKFAEQVAGILWDQIKEAASKAKRLWIRRPFMFRTGDEKYYYQHAHTGVRTLSVDEPWYDIVESPLYQHWREAQADVAAKKQIERQLKRSRGRLRPKRMGTQDTQALDEADSSIPIASTASAPTDGGRGLGAEWPQRHADWPQVLPAAYPVFHSWPQQPLPEGYGYEAAQWDMASVGQASGYEAAQWDIASVGQASILSSPMLYPGLPPIPLREDRVASSRKLRSALRWADMEEGQGSGDSDNGDAAAVPFSPVLAHHQQPREIELQPELYAAGLEDGEAPHDGKTAFNMEDGFEGKCGP